MAHQGAENNCIDTGSRDQDYILQLFGGLNSAMTTLSAIDLQIFDILAGNPMSAEQVSEAKKYKVDATRRLLNALVSIKLIERITDSDGTDMYKNSGSGRLLATTEHDNLTGLAGRYYDRFAQVLRYKLPQEVRSGSMKESPFPAHVTVHKDAFINTDQSLSQPPLENKKDNHHPHIEEDLYPRYLAMHNNLSPHIQTIVEAFDFSRHKSAVDLGGGSGALSYGLCRKYPEMEIILFEVPPVIKLVKERFLPKHKCDQITLLSGDFMDTDLPKADLYLLSQIVHDWRPDQVNYLLKNIFSALNPGGGLLLLEQCLDDDKTGPASAAVRDLVIMSSCGGGLYSAKEFTQLLQQHNFCNVQVKRTQPWCMYDIIYARKT